MGDLADIYFARIVPRFMAHYFFYHIYIFKIGNSYLAFLAKQYNLLSLITRSDDFFLPRELICLGQILIILLLEHFNVTYEHAAKYILPVILNVSLFP